MGVHTISIDLPVFSHGHAILLSPSSTLPGSPDKNQNLLFDEEPGSADMWQKYPDRAK